MRRLVLLALLLTSLAGPVAAAQDTEAEEPGRVHVDPETGERYRLVRPSEGLRRGGIPVGAWVAIAGGVLLVVAAGGVLAARLVRRRG